jgi:hypothetical protein
MTPQNEPDGWVICYPDKAAPHGYWFAGIYTTQANAERDLLRYLKQFPRVEVMPFYFHQGEGHD